MRLTLMSQLLVLLFGLVSQINCREDDWLEIHNKYRRAHGVPDLERDVKLEHLAESWVSELAPSGQLEHSGMEGYGENLAWSSDGDSSVSYLIGLWYDEMKDYDYNNPTFSSQTGHFTQLVWKDTQRVGCATAKGNGIVLVCEYSPPGNVMGQFEENVLPLTDPDSLPPRETTPEPEPDPEPDIVDPDEESRGWAVKLKNIIKNMPWGLRSSPEFLDESQDDEGMEEDGEMDEGSRGDFWTWLFGPSRRVVYKGWRPPGRVG